MPTPDPASPRFIDEHLRTPVEPGGDVVVVGAGSAGVAAALAAARRGVRTTLIDPAGFPGGTLVSGLPILGCWDGTRQIVRGFFQELMEALRERDGVKAKKAGIKTETHSPPRVSSSAGFWSGSGV